MIESDFIYTIVRTFPESILVMFAGLMLLGVKKNKMYTFKKGILLATIVFAIRRLPISLGIHTILSMVVIGVILFKISGEQMIASIIVTCKIWIALALSEGIYTVIAIQIFKIPFETLFNTTGIYGAMITLPSLIIFFGLILLFNKIRLKLNLVYNKN